MLILGENKLTSLKFVAGETQNTGKNCFSEDAKCTLTPHTQSQGANDRNTWPWHSDFMSLSLVSSSLLMRTMKVIVMMMVMMMMRKTVVMITSTGCYVGPLKALTALWCLHCVNDASKGFQKSKFLSLSFSLCLFPTHTQNAKTHTYMHAHIWSATYPESLFWSCASREPERVLGLKTSQMGINVCVCLLCLCVCVHVWEGS